MNAIPPGLSLIGICAIAVAAGAVNKVAPGEFIIDHPTLINLGFEWCSDPQQKLYLLYSKEGACKLCHNR